MCMDIDEAGRDYETASVDLAACGPTHFADGGNFAALDGDRARINRRARPVTDSRIFDQQIVGHPNVLLLPLAASRARRLYSHTQTEKIPCLDGVSRVP